ncbi:MAG: FHA domain-containing protein [Chloroflexi bacterium]|nr:FHA domain-containing protein [Chloroflexota bacterium]
MTAQFQFVMRSGPTPGATFSLEGDQLVIGRDSSSGVAINDAEVSRKHARLTFQGGKYVLEDLGSTNGTFVNGQRLASPVVLKSGDVVSFGEQIVLMYEALSGDPGATVMTPRTSAPRPMAAAPVPAPVYQAPVAPPPAPAYSAPLQTKKTNTAPIFIGIGALLFICLCAVIFWYIDANFLWCTFFPFLTGCG